MISLFRRRLVPRQVLYISEATDLNFFRFGGYPVQGQERMLLHIDSSPCLVKHDADVKVDFDGTFAENRHYFCH